MDSRKLARLFLHRATKFGDLGEADSSGCMLDELSALDLKS
jgi:hypothetical protein